MKKLSKGFYLGSIAGAGCLGLILSSISSIATLSGGVEVGALFLILGFPLSIYAGVIAFILWYKGWKSIQDGYARTTPGKAIGFVFIPIFGLYWIFQAFWGFSKDYNSLISRHNISVSRLPEGLFLTSCILSVVGVPLGFIPVVGVMFGVISFGIWIAVMNKVCNAVNNLVPFEADITKQTGMQEQMGYQKTENKLSGFAVAGLTCAILGVIPVCGLVLSIVGIIFGIIALVKVNRSDGKIQGKGMAIAAISVGVVVFVLWFLISLAWMIPADVRREVICVR